DEDAAVDALHHDAAVGALLPWADLGQLHQLPQLLRLLALVLLVALPQVPRAAPPGTGRTSDRSAGTVTPSSAAPPRRPRWPAAPSSLCTSTPDMQESTPEKLSFSGSTLALQRSRPQFKSLFCCSEGVDPGYAGVDSRKTQFFWVDPSPPKESTTVHLEQFCPTGVDLQFVLESTLTLLESTPAKVGVDPGLQNFLKSTF
ncbi:hypothetical protein Taro_038160, partial [Colocasia esculenta]|nr:hypothetical protein [Colocasia esculenta]